MGGILEGVNKMEENKKKYKLKERQCAPLPLASTLLISLLRFCEHVTIRKQFSKQDIRILLSNMVSLAYQFLIPYLKAKLKNLFIVRTTSVRLNA